MSKKKTTPTKATKKVQAAKIIVPSNGKHNAHMSDLLNYLGYRGGRPDNKLSAIAVARTLKSEWSNGGQHKLPAVIAGGVHINNYLRLLKSSPLGPTAKSLVEELGRDVHPRIASHPDWPVFIGELNSAVS